MNFFTEIETVMAFLVPPYFSLYCQSHTLGYQPYSLKSCELCKRKKCCIKRTGIKYGLRVETHMHTHIYVYIRI